MLIGPAGGSVPTIADNATVGAAVTLMFSVAVWLVAAFASKTRVVWHAVVGAV
jgi:hypothetical protein